MEAKVFRFNDRKDAMVDVARTIDANEDAARNLGWDRDHDGMKALEAAIEAEGKDQNAHFAAMELWGVYQEAAWAKERYVAYDQPVRMRSVGDKYETTSVGDWDDYEICVTIEEARMWTHGRKAGLDKRGDAYEITETKRGLDTLEYHDLIVSKEVWDDDAEDWVFAEEDPAYAIDTVPEDVREAAEASERSYWKYLDYEAGEYHGIRYYLSD